MSFDALNGALMTEDVVGSLGEPATFTPNGGSAAAVTVIFDREPVFFETDDGQILTFEAQIMGTQSELGSAQEGDQITIGARTYQIATVEPDSAGGVACKLRA